MFPEATYDVAVRNTCDFSGFTFANAETTYTVPLVVDSITISSYQIFSLCQILSRQFPICRFRFDNMNFRFII